MSAAQPDILDAIAAFRNAFLANGLQPPATVYFSNPDDGIAFLKALYGDIGDSIKITLVRFLAPGGSEYAQLDILGMSFRTPVK